MTPGDRFYTKTHEWLKVEGDVVVVGITDHAQEQLGDITFVDLPGEEDEFEAGDDCTVVESVKAASDVYAPVDGTICAVNTALEAHPELINDDPYERGWIFKLRDVDQEALEGLFDAAGYEAIIEEDDG